MADTLSATANADGSWYCCTCNTAVTVPPMPPCPIHTAAIPNTSEAEYRCLYVSYDGKLTVEVLMGVSPSHAADEAWHDCPGTVLAVQKIDD